MVRTEVRAVEPGIVRRQELDEAALHGLVVGRVVQAARDAGLVGDGDHEAARLIQLVNRLARAWEKTDFAGLVQEARVLHDGSVSIQEDGAACGLRPALRHRARPAPRASRPPARRGRWCAGRAPPDRRRCAGGRWAAIRRTPPPTPAPPLSRILSPSSTRQSLT